MPLTCLKLNKKQLNKKSYCIQWGIQHGANGEARTRDLDEENQNRSGGGRSNASSSEDKTTSTGGGLGSEKLEEQYCEKKENRIRMSQKGTRRKSSPRRTTATHSRRKDVCMISRPTKFSMFGSARHGLGVDSPIYPANRGQEVSSWG
jgi:hypothetical protein